MEVRTPFGYKSAFALLKMVTIVAIATMTVGLVFGYVLMTEKVETAYKQMVIIDKAGSVYEKGMISYNKGRMYEYEDQAKTVFKLWYGLDEYNYNGNVEAALKLLGECGKEMIDTYNQSELKSKIVQKNLVMNAEVEGVSIDMNTVPVSGEVWGKQIVRRGTGEAGRWIKCRFVVIDTDRSRDNPHGCKLENWEIIESKGI